MIQIIYKSLITFFAVYGFAQLCKEVFLYFFGIYRNKTDDIAIVIKVKNSEETLEATVRTVIWKSLSLSCGEHIPEILIVDMGSEDQTGEIALKLSKDYSFIHYTTVEKYLEAKGHTQ